MWARGREPSLTLDLRIGILSFLIRVNINLIFLIPNISDGGVWKLNTTLDLITDHQAQYLTLSLDELL